jgi:hypothetical protein
MALFGARGKKRREEKRNEGGVSGMRVEVKK